MKTVRLERKHRSKYRLGFLDVGEINIVGEVGNRENWRRIYIRVNSFEKANTDREFEIKELNDYRVQIKRIK